MWQTVTTKLILRNFEENYEIETTKTCIEQIAIKSFHNDVLLIINDAETIDYVPYNFYNNSRIIYDFLYDYNLTYGHYYFNHIIFAKDSRTLIERFIRYRTSALYHSIYTPKGRFILYVKDWSNIENVIRFLWNNYIINVMIVHNLTIYSTYPYWEKSMCGLHVLYKSIGSCDNVVNITWETYPKNLNNCKMSAIIFGTHIQMPYLDNDNVHDEKTGVLIQPLRLLTSRYKLSVNYIIPNDSMQTRWVESSNVTYDDLYNGEYDLQVCFPFQLFENAERYEISDIMFIEKKVWIVPKPKQLNKLWMIGRLFNWNLWLLWFITFLIITFAYWIMLIIKMKGNNVNYQLAFITVYRISLGIGAPNLPHNTSTRLLMMAYILYSFHVVFYFQGKLSSVLTSPNYEEPINNYERLARSNLKIAFYYHFNLNTLKYSFNRYAKILAKKSFLHSNISYNPPDLVLRNDIYASTAFAHNSNITDAHKTQVSTKTICSTCNNFSKLHLFCSWYSSRIRFYFLYNLLFLVEKVIHCY